MITAPLCFVGHTSQVLLGELLNVVRVDQALLSPGFLLFRPGSPVQGRFLPEGLFVVMEDVGLRSANARVDCRGAKRPAAGEEIRSSDLSFLLLTN